MDYVNDIPATLAQGAFSGTSMSPERRGASARSEYAETLASDYEHFKDQAAKGGTLDKLEEEFASYRAGLRTRYVGWLSSESRCVSSFIAGPSNFPAARMNKRADIAHRRLGEYLDFQKRARAAVIRNLRPDLQPIRSSDSDAVARYQEELAKLEELQAAMKAINAAHKRFLKDPATLVSSGLDEAKQKIVREYVPNYRWEPHPFAPYQLSNNNANVRRVKERIAQVSATQAQPVQELAGTAARLEDDPPANRVRLFFPGKPAEEVRTTLKRNGFRWSPTIGAWQAYRNYRTIETAKAVAGVAA